MTEDVKQPLFPRVPMIWLFVLVTGMAVLLLVIRSASDGAALAFAAVFSGGMLLMLSLTYALTFLAAYSFGRVERSLAEPTPKISSPFAYGQLPEQIVPPNPIERV